MQNLLSLSIFGAALQPALHVQPALRIQPTRQPARLSREIVMAFETEPTFQRFNVGGGLVRVHSADEIIATAPCQFGAFGSASFGDPARLRRAEPIEADRPLQSLDGAKDALEKGGYKGEKSEL